MAVVIAVAPLVVLLGCGRPDLGTPPTVCSTHAVSNGESPIMEPGGDCIGCHSSGEGPSFTFAGTVMAALNDGTNCSGVEGVTVTITGSDGRSLALTSNAVGNFYLGAQSGTITFPYKAEVTRAGKTVQMLTSRSAGETDCASCHTAEGTSGAPGRIVAP
jgi:hypothetical protein